MNALQGSLLDSRNIRVEQARVNRSLYVKFPQPITEDELMEVILAYGEVEETKLEYGQQPSDVQGENDENDENVNVQDKRAGKSNESLLSSTKAAMTKKEKQSEADKETDSDVPIIGKQNTGKHPKAEPKPLIVSATVKFCYRQCATTAFWSLRDDGHWIVEWYVLLIMLKAKYIFNIFFNFQSLNDDLELISGAIIRFPPKAKQQSISVASARLCPKRKSSRNFKLLDPSILPRCSLVKMAPHMPSSTIAIPMQLLKQ